MSELRFARQKRYLKVQFDIIDENRIAFSFAFGAIVTQKDPPIHRQKIPQKANNRPTTTKNE
jgi:hypothetical protein